MNKEENIREIKVVKTNHVKILEIEIIVSEIKIL